MFYGYYYEKKFLFIVVFCNLLYASNESQKENFFDKIIKFFKPDKEVLPLLPVELILKIASYMKPPYLERKCSQLNKNCYKVYNIHNKLRYEKIAKNEAVMQIYKMVLEPFIVGCTKKNYVFDTKAFRVICDQSLKTHFENAYRRHMEKNYIPTYLQHNKIFLNPSKNIYKISEIGQLKQGIFTFLIDRKTYTTQITIFSYNNKGIVLIFPDFAYTKEDFLKEATSQYQDVRRIIIDRFNLSMNNNDLLSSLKNSCDVCSMSDVILQDKSGNTLLSYFTAKNNLTHKEVEDLENIFNQYKKYLKKLAHVPNESGLKAINEHHPYVYRFMSQCCTHYLRERR